MNMNPKGAYQASYQQRVKEKRERELLIKAQDKKTKQLLRKKQEQLNQLEEDEGEIDFGSEPSQIHYQKPSSNRSSSKNVGLKKANSLKGNLAQNRASSKVKVNPVKPKISNLRNNERKNTITDDRSPVILTHGNGLGLWCHAKKEASISMYNEKDSNSKLPPLQTKKQNAPRPKRSAQSQRREEAPQAPSRNLTKDIDSKVESSLAQMFKQDVVELSAKLDKMENEKSKMQFGYNIMKRDYDNLAFANEKLQNDNDVLLEKSYELEERKR